jgi:hypothetical protein
VQQLVVDREVAIAPSHSWSVAVLDWPEQADEAEVLAASGALRLLLVAPGVAPPVDWDLSSDWLRRPAEPRDVLARVETLQRRSELDQGPLRLDRDGLLWRGTHWVALAPVEERLMAVLMDNVHRVVSRPELVNAGWPDEQRSSRALDVRLQRLRGRIRPLSLEIASVRQRGFVLSFVEP